MARASELGADAALDFLREIDAINVRRRSRMVDLAREECGGTLVGKRIAVLGAAFKPDRDDIRDSPAPRHWTSPEPLAMKGPSSPSSTRWPCRPPSVLFRTWPTPTWSRRRACAPMSCCT